MELKVINLKRVIKNDEGVWGVFIYQYRPFAVSGELPWHENKSDISCIPEGCYTCEMKQSASKGYVPHIIDVIGRDNILIHVGNIPKQDSLGCILIGEAFEKLDGFQAITSSKKAYGELMGIIGGDKNFLLKVEE